MKREVDLNEISDGRLYSSGDMVKVDCHDCEGCSACCQGMGDSILLDPMDLWRLQLGKKENFDTLLANYLELNVVDGMVLPNLKMAGEEEACPFLKMEDVPFMDTDRESAVCSRLDVFMKKMGLNISSRYMNVRSRNVAR